MPTDITANSQLISPSLQFPNTLHSDRWQITFSNIPTLKSLRELRLYDNYVKSVTFPEYNMPEIYSDIKGFRIRHPVAGIKANDDLGQIGIEFKVSEDMKNYANLFLWMQALKYGRSDIFKDEAEFFRLNTIKSINLSVLDNQKRPVVNWKFTEAFLLSLSSLTLNMGTSDELTFICNFSYEEIKFDIKDIDGNCGN